MRPVQLINTDSDSDSNVYNWTTACLCAVCQCLDSLPYLSEWCTLPYCVCAPMKKHPINHVLVTIIRSDLLAPNPSQNSPQKRGEQST